MDTVTTPATPEVTDSVVDETQDTGIDIESAVEKMAPDLFDGYTPADKKEAPEESAAPSKPEKPAAVGATTIPAVDKSVAGTPTTPATRPAPKSWAKDKHDLWTGLPDPVKDQIELREKQILDGLEQYKGDAEIGRGLKQVMGPYLPHLHAAGIQPERMVSNLLNAHWQLTQGTPESRKAAYEKLGRDLGLEATDPNATPVDPKVLALEQQVNELRSGLTARQQAEHHELATKTAQEVDTFASDTAAHPYFEDVADDIVALLRAYPKVSLQEAYDRAVYANPVTRAKEHARLQTEAVEQHKENERLNALPKKRAAGSNVRASETPKSAPTEPLGDLEGTLRSTMRNIKERTNA